jgi:hypothetical protein
MRSFRYILVCLSLSLASTAGTPGDPLPAWTPGTLDIHQIQTGRGNSAYLIFPDGATLLIDAGAVPDRSGPELGPQRPNASRTPGEWIAAYIEKFSPSIPPSSTMHSSPTTMTITWVPYQRSPSWFHRCPPEPRRRPAWPQ